MNKFKTLIIYSSRKTGNSKKIAEGLKNTIPDSDIFSIENAPLPIDYDFIIFGTGIYRGWPDPPMKNYMRKCKNINAAFFLTLGAWPDSEHAHICKGRIEGLLSECNVLASFICHGRIDPELVEQMKNKAPGSPHSWNNERANRIAAAENHPNDDDIRSAAQIFLKTIEKIKIQQNEKKISPISPLPIKWNLNGEEIEKESFKIIENEYPHKEIPPENWKIIRRLIHTTGDFSIAENVKFHNNPINTALNALKNSAPIYCDSNMIKAGLSIAKLKKLNPNYSDESVICYISDNDVANFAKEKSITRALAAVHKAIPTLDNAIVLIGNAPLALAKIAELSIEGKINPAIIIGMPVGFVNVIESKELLSKTNIPHILIEGRRGGSPLAVATLHAILECAEK